VTGGQLAFDSRDQPLVRRRVAVIGAGSWGTALAGLVARNADVVVWALEAEIVASINERHVNDVFHPGVPLPECVTPTDDVATAAAGAEVIVLGTPTQFTRGVLRQLVASVARQTPALVPGGPDHDPGRGLPPWVVPL
jgi:glycerol-3-phosphate dehydrogenase (NAD(P)+)